jgi:hypothetical protein
MSQVFVVAVVLAVISACDAASSKLPSVFSSQVTEVAVEVDYEAGAEPYTGAVFGGGDTWDLFKGNLNQLFDGKKTLTIPSTLQGMAALGDLPGEDFTVDAILDLAGQHDDQAESASRRTYYVLYLDGYFQDEAGRQEGVLGVSIGSTRVIALFKPVISGGSDSVTLNQRFIEQSVLVHEFAHGGGLVNNGTAVQSAHEDSSHPAHCASKSCVLYYLNEGLADLKEFVITYVTSGSSILLDQACLDDAHAALGAP